MTTPQVIITPNSEKLPIEILKKMDLPIFAYMRRSTKLKGQLESLEKQYDSMDIILKEMGLSGKDLGGKFWDSFTGYKVKTIEGKPQLKRKGFKDLVQTIKALNGMCILLAFEPARLTRNIPDGTTIKEFLGHYENKQKIKYIHFYGGSRWDKDTPATIIDAEVNKAVAYSERLSRDKVSKNIISLKKGILPATIKTPTGIKATRAGIVETEKMPYIYKAFEMKAEGRTGKVICEYLYSHGISIKEGNLKDSLYGNTIFIGTYTHSSGEIFDNLTFVKGKPAIPMTLWDKVQKRLGTKGGFYGEGQKGDIISRLLRWENDPEKHFSFSVELKKDQYKNFRSNANGGFSKSELLILQEITPTIITKIVDIYYEVFETTINAMDKIETPEIDSIRFYTDFNRINISLSKEKREEARILNEKSRILRYSMIFLSLGKEPQELSGKTKKEQDDLVLEAVEDNSRTLYNNGKLGKKLIRNNNIKRFIRFHSPEYKKLEEEYINTNQAYWEIYRDAFTPEEWQQQFEDTYRVPRISQKTDAILRAIMQKSEAFILPEDEKIKKDLKIRELEQEKITVEKRIKEIPKKAFEQGFSKTFADEQVQDEQIKLQLIEEQLESLGSSGDLEEFLEKLPLVLAKTFELLSKVLSNEDILVIRDDLYKVLEIVTFELPVSTKKELTVKLFSGIEKGISGMVGDIGFEPMTPCL